MYSDAYVKRYKAFMPLLTAMQKPKDNVRNDLTNMKIENIREA